MRTLVAWTLLVAALGPLGGCFKSHLVDEQVFALEEEGEAPVPDAGSGAPAQDDDAGRVSPPPTKDAGSGSDGDQDRCADITDIVQRFLCLAGLGGNGGAGLPGGSDGRSIIDIIRDLLGGGANMPDCSKETNPIARLLCQATSGGGGGLEGIIRDLLGGGGSLGGLLGDGGIERILIGTLSNVIRGIIDDLFQGFVDTIRNRLPGGAMGNNTRGALLRESVVAGAELPEPSDADCAEVDPDDVLTRLQCARKALDALDRALAE